MVYYMDESYSISQHLATRRFEEQQRIFNEARSEMCEHMRSPDLPPLENNQIQFNAMCVVCWNVHPFRITIQQLPGKITSNKVIEHNKIDFFTSQERADAINDINMEHMKSRVSKSPWFNL